MTDYNIVNHLINHLEYKINEILSLGNTPIIFYLIGSFPAENIFHQTPPIIQSYLEHDNISPIVILIDPIYENNLKVLSFLKEDYENIKENEWYYPTIINQSNPSNSSNLVFDFNQIVAYTYLSKFIEEEELGNIVSYIATEYPNLLNLIFSFTGFKFFDNNSSSVLHQSNIKNPNADCMADVINDIDFNPPIEKIIINNHVNFKFLDDINLEYLVNKLKLSYKSRYLNQTNLQRYFNFIKTYIIKSIAWIKPLKSWETQIRLNDPKMKVSINKNSNEQEWGHFQYRASCYLNIKDIKHQFEKSNLFTLEQYINNLIYEIGINIIETLIILNKLDIENKENIKLDKTRDVDFHQKKINMISHLSDELNTSFDIVPFKFPKIFDDIVNHNFKS